MIFKFLKVCQKAACLLWHVLSFINFSGHFTSLCICLCTIEKTSWSLLSVLTHVLVNRESDLKQICRNASLGLMLLAALISLQNTPSSHDYKLIDFVGLVFGFFPLLPVNSFFTKTPAKNALCAILVGAVILFCFQVPVLLEAILYRFSFVFHSDYEKVIYGRTFSVFRLLWAR